MIAPALAFPWFILMREEEKEEEEEEEGREEGKDDTFIEGKEGDARLYFY